MSKSRREVEAITTKLVTSLFFRFFFFLGGGFFFFVGFFGGCFFFFLLFIFFFVVKAGCGFLLGGHLQEGGMLVHLEMGCTENTNIICMV